MTKKLSPNWNISLTYYISVNLIAFVPNIVIAIVVNKFVSSIWQNVFLNIILFALVLYFALKWSSKNINKGYIVLSKRAIAYWSVGYLLFFNIPFLLFFVKVNSVSMIVAVFNVVVGALLFYILTPKLIIETSQAEIDVVRSAVVSQSLGSITKQVFSTALLTVGGFILLLVVPFIGYIILTSETSLSNKSALILIAIYVLFVIWLAKRFVFKTGSR